MCGVRFGGGAACELRRKEQKGPSEWRRRSMPPAWRCCAGGGLAVGTPAPGAPTKDLDLSLGAASLRRQDPPFSRGPSQTTCDVSPRTSRKDGHRSTGMRTATLSDSHSDKAVAGAAE